MHSQKPTNSRKARLYLVVSAAVFGAIITALAKLIGDGPIVPIVFIVGWLILAAFVLKFFSRYDWRA